jgi:GTP cyclohydrolase I
MVLHVDQDPARNNGHSSLNGHSHAHEIEHEATQTTIEERREPKVDYDRLLSLCRELLTAIGENPDREGLQDTPRRWADWWREFIEYNPGTTDTTFSAVSSDQMVCVSGMRVFSLCEHHMLPMWCDVAIAYIPTNKVLGLSKFARIAHQFAHQLQIQERLGQQIADEVSRITDTSHVAVLLKGEHLCMSARGIRTPGTMTSSVMRGNFRVDRDLRMEFMQMIQ